MGICVLRVLRIELRSSSLGCKCLTAELSFQPGCFYLNYASLEGDKTMLDVSPIKGFKQASEASEGPRAGKKSLEIIMPMVDLMHLEECRLEIFWVDSYKTGRYRVMQS